MHHDGIALGQCQPLLGQAIVFEILLRRGQKRTLHALVLQTQHHHHIDILQAMFHVVVDLHTELFDVRRQQCLRRDHAYFRHTQRRHGMDLRARHSGMQHIANDGYAQVMEFFFVVADGEHIEQRLCGVRVTPVTGVDDMNIGRHVFGNQVNRPAR